MLKAILLILFGYCLGWVIGYFNDIIRDLRRKPLCPVFGPIRSDGQFSLCYLSQGHWRLHRNKAGQKWRNPPPEPQCVSTINEYGWVRCRKSTNPHEWHACFGLCWDDRLSKVRCNATHFNEIKGKEMRCQMILEHNTCAPEFRTPHSDGHLYWLDPVATAPVDNTSGT